MSATLAAAATDDDGTTTTVTGAFGANTITVNPLPCYDHFDDMLMCSRHEQQQQQAWPATNIDRLDQTSVAATKTTPTTTAKSSAAQPPSMSATPPPPKPTACPQRTCRVNDADNDADVGQPQSSARPLSILLEFNQIYRDRLERVARDTPSNETQLKLNIYSEWVESLIAQNTDLIAAFEQIESEACKRLRLTEGRCAVDRSATDEALARAQSDVRNLVELLRRARDEKRWNTVGLVFHDVSELDVVGAKQNREDRDNGDHNQLLDRSDTDDVSDIEQRVALVQENNGLTDKIKRLESQVAHQKQASVDAHALVLEVAEKHDAICKFRTEVARLEEQLKQKDLHVHFKDNIICDLRRENKKLQRSSNAGADKHTSRDSTGNPMLTLANGNSDEQKPQQQPQHRPASGSDETPSGDEKRPQPTPPPPPSSASNRPAHQGDMLHMLTQKFDALHSQLARKDATIERQRRRLNELDGMRSLVSAFRADLEQLQCFEQLRPGRNGQPGTHKSDSTLTLAGLDKSSGFLSAESMLGSLNGSRLVTPEQSEPPPSDGSDGRPDATDGSGAGEPLVAGVQRLMQDMCTHIANLTVENVHLAQLHSEQEGGFNNGSDNSDQLEELRQTFGQFVGDIANMMDCRLPDSRSLVTTLQPAVLDDIRCDLSSALGGRDRLLQKRADEIVALRDQVHRQQQQQQHQSRPTDQIAGLERELFETKKQLAQLEAQATQASGTTRAELTELTEKWHSAQTELTRVQQQLASKNCAQSDGLRAERLRCEAEMAEQRALLEKAVRVDREKGMKAMKDLQEALSLKIDTISKLQAGRSAQDVEIQQLRNLIASHHEADQALVDKQFKLENECKHQLITISNLRSALETGSKQRSSSVAHSTAASASSSSSNAPQSSVASSSSSSAVSSSTGAAAAAAAAAAASASTASSSSSSAAAAVAAASGTTVTANTSGNTNANTNPTAINTSTHAASSLWNWWRNVHEV